MENTNFGGRLRHFLGSFFGPLRFYRNACLRVAFCFFCIGCFYLGGLEAVGEENKFRSENFAVHGFVINTSSNNKSVFASAEHCVDCILNVSGVETNTPVFFSGLM